MNPRQTWIPGTEPAPLICANPHCRTPFPPDPSQPGKRYCSVTCRVIHNNALIAARAGQTQPEHWQTIAPESMTDDHWTELACFAGGCDEGARVYLEQYRMAVRSRSARPGDDA